jgi:hypothetical protein
MKRLTRKLTDIIIIMIRERCPCTTIEQIQARIRPISLNAGTQNSNNWANTKSSMVSPLEMPTSQPRSMRIKSQSTDLVITVRLKSTRQFWLISQLELMTPSTLQNSWRPWAWIWDTSSQTRNWRCWSPLSNKCVKIPKNNPLPKRGGLSSSQLRTNTPIRAHIWKRITRFWIRRLRPSTRGSETSKSGQNTSLRDHSFTC